MKKFELVKAGRYTAPTGESFEKGLHYTAEQIEVVPKGDRELFYEVKPATKSAKIDPAKLELEKQLLDKDRKTLEEEKQLLDLEKEEFEAEKRKFESEKTKEAKSEKK